jgi:hypothetical protein
LQFHKRDNPRFRGPEMRALRENYGVSRNAPRKHDHVSVRYYLWARDGPWRIPDRLHQGLITRRIALPQCAGTAQKILEVFARPAKRGALLIDGRGSIYRFDEQGFVDLSPYAEAIDAVKALHSSHTLDEKLIDLTPLLHEQHFSRANFWKPSRLILNGIRADLRPRSAGAPKIRVLKNHVPSCGN